MPANKPNSDYGGYLSIAVSIAKHAGKIIADNFGKSVQHEYKADTTLVTEVDKRVNSYVISEITKHFPDHAVLGEEESSHHSSDSEYVWVCDPIDGTTAFSLGVPVSMFSLALVHRGEAIVAVMYHPFSGQLFTATKNSVSQLNGEPISVSKRKTLAGGHVSLNHSPITPYRFTRTIDAMFDRGARVYTYGSCVFSGVLVARGSLEGMAFPGSHPWDIAAISLLVTQAGGKVTDLDGNQRRVDREGNGCVMTNGVLHDEFVQLVKETKVKNPRN